MIDTLLVTAQVLLLSIVAVVLLAWRDARRHRIRKARTPVLVQIESIRADAAFMVKEFEDSRERSPEHATWVAPLLEYYRRLAALASADHPDVEQALQLADEADCFVRQSRLKGTFVVQQAREFADLAQRQHTD